MFQKMMLTVLSLLGIAAFAVDKDGKKTLTEEQKVTMTKFLGEKFTTRFAEALEKDTADKHPNAETEGLLLADLDDQLKKALAAQIAAEVQATTLKAENADHLRVIETQKTTIETLSAKPEAEPIIPGAMGNDKTKWVPSGKDSHLFGQNLPFMAIDAKRPYNMRAYSAILASQGVIYPVPEATAMDYDSLKSDLGDYYRIRKQERIQSFLTELPTIANTIFPLESGYQDQAVLVNMFLSEFSQAGNESSTFANVVKGGYKFEPEKITMYNVMFAYVFTDLKALEKNWLGYLNKEGSDSMKWSFIEFVMVETAKQLKNEQELRWLKGVRINPTANVVGTTMGASNGLLKFIKNQIALFKIKPFTGLSEPTSSTIANYIKEYTALIPEAIRDSGNMRLYMSTAMYSDYIQNLRTLWGLAQDYKENSGYVNEYPAVKIVPIPNMGSSKRLIWTLDKNIVLLEDKPGEMLRFNFEQRNWTLEVWSSWRESIWAYRVGKKFASLAAMPSDYSSQMIWCNDIDESADYYLAMNADDASPSAINHTSLLTVANASALAITDIDDVEIGQEIRIKWGNVTNAPTIAKSGKFSLISAAITAPEVGDILFLKKRSDGKFIELKRTVETSDSIAFTADDATPDVSAGVKFITVENQSACAITALDNAEYGVEYTIYGGSDTNAVTIANSGNFSLTSAMTLSLGTYITLVKSETDDKFYEITRG